MSETLLRCPFCGGEAELLKGQCEIDNYVMCLECRSKTKLYNTKASAIKAWNTRKPMQNIVKRLEQQARQYNRRALEVVNKSTEAGIHNKGKACSYEHAIEIVKEEGDLNV